LWSSACVHLSTASPFARHNQNVYSVAASTTRWAATPNAPVGSQGGAKAALGDPPAPACQAEAPAAPPCSGRPPASPPPPEPAAAPCPAAPPLPPAPARPPRPPVPDPPPVAPEVPPVPPRLPRPPEVTPPLPAPSLDSGERREAPPHATAPASARMAVRKLTPCFRRDTPSTTPRAGEVAQTPAVERELRPLHEAGQTIRLDVEARARGSLGCRVSASSGSPATHGSPPSKRSTPFRPSAS
jgi:hypothetical protein